VSHPLPWRGAGPGRPVDLDHLPVVLDGRLRKRWRYVGVFGARLMLCAGVVQIGVAGQTFWAVWDRERGALRERTRLWRGRRFVRLPAGRLCIDDAPVRADLRVEPGTPVETASPAGDAWIWTRKQGAVRVRGRVTVAGEVVEVDDLGCVDESAGYHDRRTAWEWSAGVGRTIEGRTVGWNLVAGIHDDPEASERSIWIDGEPIQPPPAAFAADLGAVSFPGGERLAFAGEATRRRRDDLVVFRSDYVQPFGTFSGTLPGGLELAEGRGVMERHSALW
jgi:hypothetical protein